MPSFLQQQLNQLAAPQTNIYKENYKKASVLYETAESNAYSRDDYFEIGLSGYNALLELEPGFSKYSQLFDRESKDVQRFVADASTNKLLDESIEGFLLMLSPYYMTIKPAMKAVEWLLQRYYVNEMNVDAVMMCILPYYDTPAFIRTLKVLNIDQKGRSGELNQWQWLKNAQNSGVCLTNSILYDRWQYSAAFRQFCNSYLAKLLAAHTKEKDAMPGVNFYITTVVGGLSRCANRHHQSNKLQVTDDHVYSVVRVLHVLLKSRFHELVSGAYLILMQLSISVKLQPALCNQIFALALKFLHEEKVSQLSCCMVTMTQQQYMTHMDESVVQQLQQQPSLLQHLSTDTANRRVAAFLMAYAGGYVRWCASNYGEEAVAVKQHMLEMVAYVSKFLLQPLEAYAVLRNILETVCSCSEQLSSSELASWLPAVLEQFEQCFPDGYDRTVQYFTDAAASPLGDQYKPVYQLMGQTSLCKLAVSLADCNKTSTRSESDSGAVQSVHRVLEALQDLVEARSETTPHQDQREQLSLAHNLLDTCIHALHTHQVSRSKKDSNKAELCSGEDLIALKKASVERARADEQVAWPLVLMVATTCTPMLAIKDSTEWTLMEHQHDQQVPADESSVLLAVKLLHVLLARPTKAKKQLHQLLQSIGGPRRQLQLLVMLWGWQPYLPHHYLVTPHLQVWCLEQGLSMIQSTSGKKAGAAGGGAEKEEGLVQWLCGSSHPAVPSLVSALSLQHEDLEQQRNVREAAGRVLTELWERSSTGISSSDCSTTYTQLMRVLHQHSTTICLDHKSHELVSVVSSSCSSSSALLQCVVGAATLPSQPPHLAAVLLFAVSQLQHKAIFEGLLPSINAQLERINSITTTVSKTTASNTSKTTKPEVHQQQQHEDRSSSSAARDVAAAAPLSAGKSMFLYWSLIHFNSSSGTLLNTDLGWSVFSSALNCSAKVIRLEDQLLSPQSVIAEQIISHKVLREVEGTALIGRMWSAIAGAAADLAVGHREAQRLVRALRDAKLHARFVLDQIQQLHLCTSATSIRAAQAKRLKLVQEKGGMRRSRKTSTSGKKSTKSSEDPQPEQTSLPSNWRKLYLLLELLCEVQEVEEPWLLVEPLCDCMHEALALGLALAERVVQQILASLHHLITLAVARPPQDAELSSVVQLNVELLVQCVRQSSDPYTHRRALLVLSLAATIQPDAVLHNLMTIFTFMGEGLLQRDDQFSYQVIETTVSTLVPILVERSTNSEEVCGIVQVFVDALPDIPTHRRMVIFKLLTEALKPDKHLWLVVMLIIKSYIMHGYSRLPEDQPSSGEGRRMPREINFALHVTDQFSVQQQVAAAHAILETVRDIPNNIGVNYKQNWKSSNALLMVLDLPQLRAKQLRHLIYTSVGFLAQLFTSDNFIATMVPVTENLKAKEMAGLQRQYERMFSTITIYLQVVDKQMMSTQEDDALAHKFWCSLQRKLVELLESVCSLLQPQLLLRVTEQLMDSAFTPVRIKALELLRTRLLPSAAFFSESEVEQLTALVERLHQLSVNEEESDETRQVALSTLQMLLHFLASHTQRHVPMLRAVLISTLGMVTSQGVCRPLVLQSLLVVGECIEQVKQESIEVVNKLVPTLLQFLTPPQQRHDDAPPVAADDHLSASAASVLYKLVEHVPKFLSRYMKELVTLLCRLSWQHSEQQAVSAGKESSKLAHKLAALASLLKDKIEPRVLVPALRAAYEELSSGSGDSILSVCGVLQLLQDFTANMSTAAVTASQPELLPILTLALSARHNHASSDTLSSSTIDTLEESAVISITHLVMRQDEAANLKMFSTLQSWAQSLSSIHANIAFFRLVQNMASTLKVLFIKTHLADHVFSHAIQTLAQTYSPGKKMKKRRGDSTVCLLLEHVLASLTQIFTHDSVAFTSEIRFKQILDTIVDQVCNTVGGATLYQKRISAQLEPCILSLCTAARSDALWSDLNKKMLMLLRQDLEPEVHASVLSLTYSLVELLKEDWLQPLLTDTLPHVTEALESSHAVVEHQARRLLTLMEELMGEAVKEQLDV